MKTDVKKRWIEALRSGKYKQCREQLTNGKGYCCLGVLTDLYVQEKRKATGWSEFEDLATLPELVSRWAGLEDDDPEIEGCRLSCYNDGFKEGDRGKSFKTIAKLIEEYL